jgi:hypothetical protein
MAKLTTRFLIIELATIVWLPSICSRGGVLLIYPILKRGGLQRLRNQESIEGGQQEEGSTSRATPEHKKELRPKQVILTFN